MSIINDAIKKARRESDIKNQPIIAKDIGGLSEKKVPLALPPSSETRWMTAVVVSLVIVASLFGSLALYKHIAKSNVPYRVTTTPMAQPQKRPSLPPRAYHKTVPSASSEEGILKLNGIVYGPEDKWAIINNRIVREGNSLPGGKLTHIAKDFVKIKKDTGEEFILDLQ